jgi:hypothetical protein
MLFQVRSNSLIASIAMVIWLILSINCLLTVNNLSFNTVLILCIFMAKLAEFCNTAKSKTYIANQNRKMKVISVIPVMFIRKFQMSNTSVSISYTTIRKYFLLLTANTLKKPNCKVLKYALDLNTN